MLYSRVPVAEKRAAFRKGLESGKLQRLPGEIVDILHKTGVLPR